MSVVLIEHLPLLSTAPNGIKKLRSLILELAVRGKLVQQDRSDEPAHKLLERIAQERAQLEAAGACRKSKPMPPVGDEQKLFAIPVGWEWVAFGNATVCRDGERIPVSLEERNQRERIYDYYGASGVIDKIDAFLFDKPLLLIGEDGANLINRSSPIAFIARGKYWVNNHAHVIDGINEDYLRYLELFINAIDLKPYVTGTAQPKMNQAKMNSIPIALPPEPEQRRIVARVDELMTICDQLETEQVDTEVAHAKLVDTLIDSLTQSIDAADVTANWSRLAEHFDALFTTEASIDALKQAILQLAVIGKLVPQDPEDEPADELLKRIAKERTRLKEEGRWRKSPLLEPFKQDEDYAIPTSWSWCRLGNMVIESGAGWSPSCEPRRRRNDEWGILKVSAVSWGTFNPDENKALPSSLEPRAEHEVVSGDFLVSRANTAELVARSVVVGECPPRLMLSDKIVRLKLSGLTDAHFINLANSCSRAREYYAAVAGGTSASMKNVSREQILNLAVALPPLAEQRRIVAKVNNLMTVCDNLKADLAESRHRQARLASTLIESALKAA